MGRFMLRPVHVLSAVPQGPGSAQQTAGKACQIRAPQSQRNMRRRRLLCHAEVRSIFHRRLQQRSGRPCCVARLSRLRRCGATSSVP